YFVGGVARKRGHRRRLGRRHLRPGPVFGASGSSAFYRREAFLRAGGVPVEFGSYFEDVDLAFRLRRLGGRTWYEPASVVWHDVGASQAPGSALLSRQSRNEEWLWWRNLPLGTLLAALPLHAAVVLAKALRRAWHGELRPFLRGRWQAWRTLPE